MTMFSTDGRIRRTDYILHKLNSSLILFAVILFSTKFIDESNQFLNETVKLFLFLLAFGLYFILDIITTVKRFHDLNKDGSHYFYLFIPIYNVILSIGLLFEKGTDGDNNFGGDPRMREEELKKSKTLKSFILLVLLAILVWQLIMVAES